MDTDKNKSLMLPGQEVRAAEMTGSGNGMKSSGFD